MALPGMAPGAGQQDTQSPVANRGGFSGPVPQPAAKPMFAGLGSLFGGMRRPLGQPAMPGGATPGMMMAGAALGGGGAMAPRINPQVPGAAMAMGGAMPQMDPRMQQQAAAEQARRAQEMAAISQMGGLATMGGGMRPIQQGPAPVAPQGGMAPGQREQLLNLILQMQGVR